MRVANGERVELEMSIRKRQAHVDETLRVGVMIVEEAQAVVYPLPQVLGGGGGARSRRQPAYRGVHACRVPGQVLGEPSSGVSEVPQQARQKGRLLRIRDAEIPKKLNEVTVAVAVAIAATTSTVGAANDPVDASPIARGTLIGNSDSSTVAHLPPPMVSHHFPSADALSNGPHRLPSACIGQARRPRLTVRPSRGQISLRTVTLPRDPHSHSSPTDSIERCCLTRTIDTIVIYQSHGGGMRE